VAKLTAAQLADLIDGLIREELEEMGVNPRGDLDDQSLAVVLDNDYLRSLYSLRVYAREREAEASR
jgi:hypothetical protein